MKASLITEERPDADVELYDRKTVLLGEISKLGATIEEMDAKVANHQASMLESGKLEQEIAARREELFTLQKSVSEFTLKKSDGDALKIEIDSLTKEKIAKEEEITYLKSVIRVLQEESEKFRNSKEIINIQMKEKTDKHKSDIDYFEKRKEEVRGLLHHLIDKLQ